ncbi:MAG TPA: YceI family protein [Solirubrobacteraceae bacterium]|nr:YceI family protein [Solirubrobacteraceae bacterium]
MTKLIRRPTTKRGTAIAIAASVGLVGVLAFLAVYFLLFPTSSPSPFKLSASAAASGQTSPSSTATARAGSPSATLGSRWTIAAGSQAGYRVREKLAFLPAQSDAVGRTSQITGGATVTASKDTLRVTAASFTVAVNTLTSDRSMRDERIHSIGLESDRYPTATFVLSSPVTVSLSALSGRVAHVSATGTFNIHGTSRQETVPLEMSLSGSTLQTAGALTFPWSAFNMTAPSVGGFVNVTEHATMEFDLRLTRV